MTTQQQEPLDVETTDEEEQPRTKAYTSLDHYNAGAEALQQIAAHHKDDDFGVQDAMVLIELARTHAEMGQLKLNIDLARWSGKME